MKVNFIDIIFSKKINRLIFFISLSILIFTISYNIGMFWDNVLFASKMGNHLYYTSIFNWYIPDSFDPGHPPLLGFLLAIFWNIFGHNLWASHLLMIPFTFGLFYQIHQFISYYIKSNLTVFFGFLLIIADPTLFTQFVLVNPEVIQLFFFFLVINSILYNRYYLKIIGLFFLSIITYRSMMLCAGVFFFEVLNNRIINKIKIRSIFSKKFISSYLIGSIPAVVYIVWRLIAKGWIMGHQNTWETQGDYVSGFGFLKNVIILIHRYLDFGRIFLVTFIVFSIIKFKRKLLTNQIKQIFLLSITSIVIIIITSLITTNPFGHRYFIASYITLNLLAFIILQKFYKSKVIIYLILLIGLLSGNLWIYPRNIAQGWDASLAHLPYYNLRSEAIKYLDKEQIEIDSVASFFPNKTTINNIDLNEDLRSFKNFNGNNKYVFFSNIYNLSDDEYAKLDTKYIIIKQFKKNNIYINIYKLK